VEDSALERTLDAAETPRQWLDAMAAQVLQAASHKTSHDNFSALVVWTS
jgi:hypothetical protein